MPKNLLLADDSITIQKVVGITFAQEDYDITYTDNGEDAVKKAKEIKPDIILADIIMPQKNGYEVCEAVKKDPDISTIPVLLLAGTFETFDESRGKQVGADGYIIKPFESQALIDKVNDLVSKKGAPKVEIPEAPAPTPPAPPAPEVKIDAPETASSGMFSPETPPTLDAPVMEPPKQADMPQIPDTPLSEPPVMDKRMEPMLDLEPPAFADPELPKETPEAIVPEQPPEVPASANADAAIGDAEVLSHSDSGEPQLDLASPADFIMDATGEAKDEIAVETPEGKKEDFVEIDKPPTFDFVSGEADLKGEAPKTEGSPFASFPDLGTPPTAEEPAKDSSVFPKEEEMVTQPPIDIPEPKTQAADPEPPTPDLVSLPPVETPEEDLKAAEAEVEMPKIEETPVAKDASEAMPKIPEDQMEELVKKVSQAVIEKIAWEVVPDLAERIIREEIKRLTEEGK